MGDMPRPEEDARQEDNSDAAAWAVGSGMFLTRTSGDGTRRWWSPVAEAARLFQLPGVGAKGSEWLDRIHPEDLGRVREKLGRAVAGECVEFAYRFRNGPTQWVWLSESLAPEIDGEGRVAAVRGLCQAQTPAQRARARIEEPLEQGWFHTGAEFFERALPAAAAATGAAAAIAVERDPLAPGGMRALSAWQGKERIAELRYPLRNMPCEEVMAGRTLVVEDGVAARSPEDSYLRENEIRGYAGAPLRDGSGAVIGAVILLFRTPVREPRECAALLEALAFRAQGELARLQSERLLQENETRFRLLDETIQEIFWVFDVREMRLAYVSRGFDRVMGFPREELMANPEKWKESIVEGDAEILFDQAERMMKEPVSREFRIRRPNGEERWIRDRAFPSFGPGGETVRVVGVARDITDEKLSLEAVWESQRYVTKIAEALPAVLYLWDQEDRKLTLLNPQSHEFIGYSSAQLEEMGDDIFPQLLHPADYAKLPTLRRQLERSGEGATVSTTFRIRHLDGSYRWFSGRETVFSRSRSGAPKLILGVAQDISDTVRLEQELLHSALHDRQTSLPNRILFEERLEQSAKRAHRGASPHFALLLLDIDRFQRVNEGLGHEAGDLLLVALARRLEQCIREGDTVARFGSDEFGVLLDGLQAPSEASLVAERLAAAIRKPFEVAGSQVHLSASLGIAISPPGAGDPNEMMRQAELALLSAKRSGIGTFRIYDASEHSGSPARLQLEGELRAALEREEFELLYQPICAMESGRVMGFECLLRWRHPSRGLIAPGEFLREAADIGLLEPISDWVLNEACRQLTTWDRDFGQDVYLSVNIDGRQLARADFGERIAEKLREHGVRRGALQIELTETAITPDLAQAAALLGQLREMGAAVLLDDFGVGFSSLSRLSRLPIDVLKMDRSFLDNLGEAPEDTAILRAILTLARDLGKLTIAEGVETAEQARLLREAGCPLAQGFYYYPPLTAAEASRVMRGQGPCGNAT